MIQAVQLIEFPSIGWDLYYGLEIEVWVKLVSDTEKISARVDYERGRFSPTNFLTLSNYSSLDFEKFKICNKKEIRFTSGTSPCTII